MKVICGGKLFVLLAMAFALVGIVPACHAHSAPDLDKHARKIHKKLAKYKAGSYLQLVLRDDSERSGALGTLTETSFTLTNSENNTPETHSYSDVAKVWPGKQYIGEGSGPGIHIQHPIRWAVIGVLAAGAAVAAVEVR